MLKKSCPHCFKRIPLLKQWKTRCPYCFRTIRQRSGTDRNVFAQWLEDRGTLFWFFMLLVIHVITAMIGQVTHRPGLLKFIDEHYIWFGLTLFYLAGVLSVAGRIFFPLMLGAPSILRKERAIINQYKWLTAIGLALGPVLTYYTMGTRLIVQMYPAAVFLSTIPLALFWSYLALVLHESDYEDERTWSFLAELGAAERIDHRHHGYMVMVMLPLAALLFYGFMQNLWIAYMMRNSILVQMFKALWLAASGQEPLRSFDELQP